MSGHAFTQSLDKGFESFHILRSPLLVAYGEIFQTERRRMTHAARSPPHTVVVSPLAIPRGSMHPEYIRQGYLRPHVTTDQVLILQTMPTLSLAAEQHHIFPKKKQEYS